jgi:hypothetical protein
MGKKTAAEKELDPCYACGERWKSIKVKDDCKEVPDGEYVCNYCCGECDWQKGCTERK